MIFYLNESDKKLILEYLAKGKTRPVVSDLYDLIEEADEIRLVR